MESTIRDLERTLAANPFDFDTRRRLTQWFLRADQGQFVVWRGELDAKGRAKCALACFGYQISVSAEVVEPAYLLAVTGLPDLTNLLVLNPDGIFTLPSKNYAPLHQGNTAGAKKLASLEYTKEVELRNRPFAPQLSDPATPGRLRFPTYEVLEQPLYDREILEPGDHYAGSVVYFATALGTQKSPYPSSYQTSSYQGELRTKRWVKHQTDTNMDQASYLPYPKNFTITGFSLFPQQGSNRDEYRTLIDNSWFRFFIGTMDYLILPAATVAGTISEYQDFTFRISAPACAHYQLPNAFDLIPLQNFRAELVLDPKHLPEQKLTLTEPLSIMCVLWGHLSRRLD